MTSTLLQSPLRSYHEEHGARFTAFAGWEMPLHYGSVLDEHRQCRASGSIFDVSHMARITLKGLHARRLLERICTRRITTMQPGQARYSLLCNEAGGVIDDVLVNRRDDDDFLVVANASNRAAVLDHIHAVRDAAGWKLTVDDETERTAMVAIQGPRVMELIARVSSEIPALKRYRFTIKNMIVMKLMVSRTGYTGEDGVEVILPRSTVGMALRLLLKDVDSDQAHALLRPAGLGARDTLRLEAGMPLYGHELAADINAMETGLAFAIDLDKSEAADGASFIGQEALLAVRDAGGPARRLVAIACDGRRSPRQSMPIATPHGHGIVTSGCMSPTLDRPIALAYVPAATADGSPVTIDPDRTAIPGEVRPIPLYRRP